jgi:hypothetical protein
MDDRWVSSQGGGDLLDLRRMAGFMRADDDCRTTGDDRQPTP